MDHVIVLTAAPEAGLPDEALFEACQALEDCGQPRRLSPSAAEIPVPEHVTLDPGGEPIDVNCLPAAGRRKRLLIADMDSTIITVECIDEMAEVAGVRDRVVAMTEPAMRGEISFEEALRARVALMAGMPAARLNDVWHDSVRLTPGARVLVATMAAHGAHAALVSGGFTFFTERVAAAAGFHEHRANVLTIDAGRLTGTVAEPVLGRAAKRDALAEITARLGIGAGDALAVGDGANDLAMIGAAGLGVAFRSKPVVAAEARARISHGDLTALLYLQGYTEAEFAV